MSIEQTSTVVYQIRVRGHLDLKWRAWFDGFKMTQSVDETLLEGPVEDQAALHGLLAKIRNLGLVLLSIQRIEVSE